MQFTTKKALILLLGVLISLGLLGCKTTTTTTTAAFTGTTPSLSNPDDIFFSGGNYDITYGDIYEEFKVNDGINRLLFMVDSVLLSDYISAVTASEIADKIKYLTYGTSDDTEIADLDTTEKQSYETSYLENMSLLGYADNPEVYVKMIVAKEHYAAYSMGLSDNSDETWYVGPSTIATYFDTTYFDDLSAIKIRFYNETDAKNVMKKFNLVSINGTLKLYTGTKPIEEVPSSSFNETNTAVLTQDQLIDVFTDMYNYVYGDYRDTVSKDLSVAELSNLADLKVNYLDMFDASSSLSAYIFTTLGSLNEFNAGTSSKIYYTYAPVKYYGTNDTSYYMILNINRPSKVDVSGFDGNEADLVALIGQDNYDTIQETLTENYLGTSGFVAARIASLRSDNDFQIFDYYLGVDYQAIDTAFVPTEEGNATIVASYGSTQITADDLFTYSMNINGALYTLYAAQLSVVMDAYFEQVYCSDTSVACEYDLTLNTSDKIEEHRTTLADLKASFEASYYVYYYTFDEYIYLAYGAKSEEDMIGKYYVKSNLQPYLVYDEIRKNNWELLTDYLYGLVEDYYNNYFSLNVQHLLIYMDRNEDGTQDNYDDFLASLSNPSAYQDLLARFETTISNYLDQSDNNTYTTLIAEYLKAKRTDATWGEFKRFGFYLMTEDLSSTESLTYSNSVDTYEEPFVNGLIQTYEQYLLPENENADSIYYDNFIQTVYGIHMIYAEKGSNFEKPTAKFIMTYDADGNPNYTEGIQNDLDMPSIDQLKLYTEYRFDQIVYGTAADAETTYDFTLPIIPTSVLNSMEAYYTSIHDSMYIVGFLNIIVSEKLQTGDFVNQHAAYCSTSVTKIKARLTEIGDIYFKQVFQSLDNTQN
jgi:hypothetical protein